MADLMAIAAEERRALADDIEKFSEAQWTTPSALKGWQVRHVASHLVWPLESGLGAMAWMFVRSGFSFTRTVDNAADQDRRNPAQLAAALRAQAGSTKVPPGLNPLTILLDVMVHSLDIRHPLGLEHRASRDGVIPGLKRLANPGSARFYGVPQGYTFVAKDLGLTVGSGPRVEGDSNALLLTMAGRPARLKELTGDGADAFRAAYKGYLT